MKIENGRALPVAPTPFVAKLARLEPDFYKPEHLGLCSNTPINTVAAMLVEKLRYDLIDLCDEFFCPAEFANSISNHKAVELMHNVPLDFSQISSQQENTIVSHVLYKRGCGKLTGIVLTGDLAGVILDGYPEEEVFIQGMRPNRIWNDGHLRLLKYDQPQLLTAIESMTHLISYNDYYNAYNFQARLRELINDNYHYLCQKYDLVSEAFFDLSYEILPREVTSQMLYANFHRSLPISQAS